MSVVLGDMLFVLVQCGELEFECLVCLVVVVLCWLYDFDLVVCFFDYCLEWCLDIVCQWVEVGLVDEVDFDDDYCGCSVMELYCLLFDWCLVVEDLVVVYGDVCLLNLLVEGWCFSGFIDCGWFGVVDWYQDLVLVVWDIEVEFGVVWVEVFFVEYGGDIDGEWLVYFRLLDEFFQSRVGLDLDWIWFVVV